jgi:hypothetical protein
VGKVSPETAGVLAENPASRKTSSKKLRKTGGFDLERPSIGKIGSFLSITIYSRKVRTEKMPSGVKISSEK